MAESLIMVDTSILIDYYRHIGYQSYEKFKITPFNI
jgi:hypothetical protein